MKKRIMCLLLCVLLIVPCTLSFTACNDEETEYLTDAEGNIVVVDDSAITLTLYGITNDSTTEEAVARVEDAINSITKAQYSIQIDLRLYPEDEYYNKLEAALEATYIKEEETEEETDLLGNPVEDETESDTETETETEKTVETFINANGLPEIVYPSAEENQVDIFLITGVDKFGEFDRKGWLADLTKYLSGDGAFLKSYIYPHFLTAGRTADGTVKAIPNNGVIGEYTYLLINRELADKYYYDTTKIVDFKSVKAFIEDTMSEESEDYIWMLNEPAERLDRLYPDAFFGGTIDATGDNYSTNVISNVVLGADNIERLVLINDYKSDGRLVYGKPEDYADEKIACAFITGNADAADKYSDDYYTIVYSAPVATDYNTLDAMFAISSTCEHSARATQILTLLSTSKEFVNLLAYGVEGTDYVIREGMLNKLDDTYSMNLRYCGNEFLIRPSSVMDEETLKLSANNWALAKQQNLDSRESLFLGFRPVYSDETNTNESYRYPYTEEIIREIRLACSEIEKDINSFEEYTDDNGKLITFEDHLTKLSKTINGNEYAVYLLHKEHLDSVGYQYTNYFAYRKALLDAKNTPVETEEF